MSGPYDHLHGPRLKVPVEPLYPPLPWWHRPVGFVWVRLPWFAGGVLLGFLGVVAWSLS